MSEVFIAIKGELTPASKKELKAVGIVVVEVEDLDRVRFVRSTEVVSSNDMVWAALDALVNDDDGYKKATANRERLARNLLGLVNAQRKAARHE